MNESFSSPVFVIYIVSSYVISFVAVGYSKLAGQILIPLAKQPPIKKLLRKKTQIKDKVNIFFTSNKKPP